MTKRRSLGAADVQVSPDLPVLLWVALHLSTHCVPPSWPLRTLILRRKNLLFALGLGKLGQVFSLGAHPRVASGDPLASL